MTVDEKELDKRIVEWKKRMDRRKRHEDLAKKEEAEKLRQDYLNRTGRDKMKP